MNAPLPRKPAIFSPDDPNVVVTAAKDDPLLDIVTGVEAEPQLPALTREHRVLNYEMRGHGRTSAPSGPYSFAMLTADVVALLDHLKPTPAALDALGQQRAAAVRDALLANKELNPERVFIVAKPMEAAPAAGAVRMEMKLE